MFSDLVGSTALSARMDPEDLREVISAYQKCVAETVQRFGGFVAKYMGDGVLVYFGYPAGPRGRCRAGGPGGAGVDPSGGRVEVQCSTANPCGHCHRVGRSRRSDRIGCGSGASGCRRDAEPRGPSARHCRAEHGRHRREHAKASRQSVRCWKTSAQRTSRASPGRCELGRRLRPSFSRKPLRGTARERTDRACRSGRRTRTSASALVKGKEPAKAKWCCCPARPALASRGSRLRCWNVSLASRTRACAISVRRSTPTARFTRSSARWNAPPDLRTTTPRKRSSTSSTRCWRRPRPGSKTRHSLPRCCRCRTMDVIPRSI